MDRNRRGVEQRERGWERGMEKGEGGEEEGCPTRISVRPLEFLWLVFLFFLFVCVIVPPMYTMLFMTACTETNGNKQAVTEK